MLNDIKTIILEKQDLTQAIGQIKRLIPANPTDGRILSRVESIEEDYRLMCTYMFRGFKDPQAESIYKGLLRRAYEVSNDLLMLEEKQKRISLMRAAASERLLNGKQDRIKETLEKFVQDVAVASLSEGEEAEKTRKKIHANHQSYVSRLFDAIVVSEQWTDATRQVYEELLLSPLIDSNDILQIVSAITLSAINVFDLNKWLALTFIYEKATEVSVRQRCLVGWVLSLPEEDVSAFPEITVRINELTASESVRKELLELQMQLFYCCNAEADSNAIKRDIMPTLIENNNLVMTRAGIVEREDDTLSEILHPDAADRRMEAMENSFKRMMDMQQAGSDIYFGGFSQMKRFAFFESLCNWFCPFYVEHPQLQEKIGKLQQIRFFDTTIQNGPFCESDKYSFAFGLASIVDQLPDNIKEMLGNETSIGGSATDEERNSPAYIRRMYLQDVYRFFKIFQYKSDFRSPFDVSESKKSVLFFANNLFKNTQLVEEQEALLKFLYKRKAYGDMVYLDQCCPQNQPSILVLVGSAYLYTNDNATAHDRFTQAYNQNATDEQVLKGLAKTCFAMGDYLQAAQHYSALLGIRPQSQHYALNLAISQICSDKTEEGMATLFRLSYEQPDNLNVKRALAWGHLLNGNAEKAEAVYDVLTNNANCIPTDFVNAAYAKWFQQKIAEAVDSFRSYITKRKESENKVVSLYEEFRADQELMKKYNISGAEQRIMCDLVSGRMLQ